MVGLQIKLTEIRFHQTACRTHAVRLRDQDDPHDDAHPERERSAKRRRHQNDDEYQRKQVAQTLWKNIADH
ncbi:hypothetical protein Tco_1548921 [Tanacetum coccineum]